MAENHADLEGETVTQREGHNDSLENALHHLRDNTRLHVIVTAARFDSRKGLFWNKW